MTSDTRRQPFGQAFGVPDEAWPAQPDGDGIRHLHLSMRRPRGENDRSAAWLWSATGLLGLLAAGLFVVSFAAQDQYIFSAKHQSLPSVIEALSLDVAMTVFSLLALALAWKGQSARTERVLVVVCAFGSAGMNYAAANGGSPRSVAAYIVPPLLLAVVVDRLVAVVRRFVIGDTGSSAWSGAGRVVLYGLRFILAAPSTASGLRRQVLVMTPLPDAPEKPVLTAEPEREVPAAPRSPRAYSKTSRFLALVEEHYGPLAQIDRSQVSPISTALAPLVEFDTGAARSVLGYRVKAAQNGSHSS